MKLTLDLAVDVGEVSLDIATLLQSVPDHREALADPDALEGRIVIQLDDQECGKVTSDPLIRLLDLWLRKLPWVLGGDTETVALRNSEQCFAFVPAGASVELSFFTGTEAEVEEYLIEPTVLRLDAFVVEVLGLGERLLELLAALNPKWTSDSEPVRDLQTSFGEAKAAWHDHQLHPRR